LKRAHTNNAGTNKLPPPERSRDEVLEFVENTLVQLMPHDAPTLLGTQNSAFTPVLRTTILEPSLVHDELPPSSRPDHDSTQRLLLNVRPDAHSGSLQVDVRPLDDQSADFQQQPPGQFVIEVAMLRSLVEHSLVLKIPLNEPGFDAGTVLSVDPGQLLQCLPPPPIVDQHLAPSPTVDQHLAPSSPYLSECIVCAETFANVVDSDRHFASDDHEAALLTSSSVEHHRAFACASCPKSFDSRAKLRRHETVHTRQRAFSCHVCSQRYSQKPSLQAHLRAAHQGLRPFVCVHCDKSFQHRWNLRRHAKIHEREQLHTEPPPDVVDDHPVPIDWTHVDDTSSNMLLSL